MITDSASIVLFAIKSACKLGQQIRTAVVDSTRRREITLPLPNFFSGTNEADAADFFNTPELGKKFVPGFELPRQGVPACDRLPLLLKAAAANTLTVAQKRELIELHAKYKNITRAEQGGLNWKGDDANGSAGPDELFAFLSIQQWQKGTDPTPSALHRMAGTLVEIGIDYALSAPDLFDKNSRKGKALLGFLTALDGLNLPELELSEVPARLFVAVLETATENSALLSGDPKIQGLVQATTEALAQRVNQRMAEINANAGLDAIGKRDAHLNVQDWGELVFRATLSSAGEFVLSDPGKFIGVKGAGGTALVSAVGNSIFDLALVDGGKFADVLSRASVETILKAALAAVAAHPDILVKSNNEGVKKLLVGLASDLSKTNGLLQLDVLPDIARMTLTRTAQNFPLFWPDLAHQPESNLLAAAARMTLEILSSPTPAGSGWKLRFARDELLQITESVLDEFVANPGWLVDRGGRMSPALSELLSAVVGVLRERADPRLSTTAGVAVLRMVVGTAVLRQEFVTEKIAGIPMMAAIIDAIMATLFAPAQNSAAAWRLVSTAAVSDIVAMTLRIMSRHSLDAVTLKKVIQTLEQEVKLVVKGSGLDLSRYAPALEKALAA